MIIDRPEFNKVAGFHLGTVIYQLAHGRLKVFIPGVYPDILSADPVHLPTALQMTPSFGGNYNGNGCFSYPNIGATVVCSFLNGDQNCPIVLGTIQGGANAYNQYNYVKELGELSSDRHMITTGNTHVRFHEDGQLNVFMQRPYDNVASVDFDTVDGVQGLILAGNTFYDGKMKSLSATGIVEPVKDMIKKHETSCINCSFSMSDVDGYGHISSGMTYQNFGNHASAWMISTDEIPSSLMMTSDSSSQEMIFRNISQNAVGNSEQLCSVNTYKYALNETDYTGQHMVKEKTTQDIRQTEKFDRVLGQEMSLKNMSDVVSSYFNYNTRLSVFDSNYLTSHDMAWTTMSAGVGNSFGMSHWHNINRTIPMLSSDDMSADSIIDMPAGAMELSAQYIRRKKIFSSDIQRNNFFKTTIDLRDNARISRGLSSFCLENAALPTYNLICDEVVDSKEGYMRIQIINRDNLKECTVYLRKNGRAEIVTSEEVRVNAPKITLEGAEIDLHAAKINIAATAGDCKIGNVSLLEHAHVEMQSGDVVTPGSAKTKSAKQSN